MEPSADGSGNMDAWNVVFGNSEPQHEVADSINQSNETYPSCSMNVDQVALRGLDNAEVKPQVAGRLQDSIASTIEKSFMIAGAMLLATDAVALQKVSTLNELIDVLIS